LPPLTRKCGQSADPKREVMQHPAAVSSASICSSPEGLGGGLES
jgi:hypothetical protein